MRDKDLRKKRIKNALWGLFIGDAQLKTGLIDHGELATEIEAFAELAVTSVGF
jgi:hypothetical protein